MRASRESECGSATEATRAAIVGGTLGLTILVLAFAVPPLTGWDVGSRSTDLDKTLLPPLHGYLQPTWWGPGTAPALLVGLIGVTWLPRWSRSVPWPALVGLAYLVGLAWSLSLAFVDGSDGIARVQEEPTEYLGDALAVDDVRGMLGGFVERIPYGSENSWDTHVSGHPPAALLFFVGLVRLGIDTPVGVGMAIAVIAAASVPAVLVCLRALGAEDLARQALPFLVLTPAVVFQVVSADAVFAAVTSTGLAFLALATRAGGGRRIAWSLAAGGTLGLAVFLSYGLPLMGILALAVLALGGSWRPLPWALAAALGVTVIFGLLGFWWWEGYGPLHDRYWLGIASERPQAYWFFGDLGALAVSAGPLLGAGLGAAVARARAPGVVRRLDVGTRTAVVLPLAALVVVLAADLSRMSKAEVERIWLPFMPWLLLSMTLLPARWQRPALAVHVVAALVLQHLVYTHW